MLPKRGAGLEIRFRRQIDKHCHPGDRLIVVYADRFREPSSAQGSKKSSVDGTRGGFPGFDLYSKRFLNVVLHPIRMKSYGSDPGEVRIASVVCQLEGLFPYQIWIGVKIIDHMQITLLHSNLSNEAEVMKPALASG